METKLEWHIDETSISATRNISATEKGLTHILKFEAKNIRPERGHPYATIRIYLNNLKLESDDISLHKREERNRLVNQAHNILKAQTRGYAKDTAQKDMLDFTEELWEKWIRKDGVRKSRNIQRVDGLNWLLKPYILKGAGSILFAPPGTGKSWLAVAMAVVIDAGHSNVWTPERQANVLYVNLERDEDDTDYRIHQANAALLGEDYRDRSIDVLHKRGSTLTEVSGAIQDHVDNNDVGLVILDSLSRAGASLVDDTAANRTMDTMNRLGCAWLAVAHPPRADSDHVFGSQMFTAAADMEWKLSTVNEEDKIYMRLEATKVNAKRKGSLEGLLMHMKGEYGIQGLEHIDPRMIPEPMSNEDRVEAAALASLTDDNFSNRIQQHQSAENIPF